MTQALTLLQTEAGRTYLLALMDRERGLSIPMRHLVTNTGNVYAVVPSGTTVERAERFEAGGLVSVSGSEDFLVKRITTHCRSEKAGVVLLQDLWATPADYPNPRAAPSYFINDGSVYLWAETDRLEDLHRSIGLPISWIHVCYLIPNPAAAQQFRDGSRTADTLAPEITEIYVPAYDEESFVIWTRR